MRWPGDIQGQFPMTACYQPFLQSMLHHLKKENSASFFKISYLLFQYYAKQTKKCLTSNASQLPVPPGLTKFFRVYPSLSWIIWENEQQLQISLHQNLSIKFLLLDKFVRIYGARARTFPHTRQFEHCLAQGNEFKSPLQSAIRAIYQSIKHCKESVKV